MRASLMSEWRSDGAVHQLRRMDGSRVCINCATSQWKFLSTVHAYSDNFNQKRINLAFSFLPCSLVRKKHTHSGVVALDSFLNDLKKSGHSLKCYTYRIFESAWHILTLQFIIPYS